MSQNIISKANIENIMMLTDVQEGMLYHYIHEINSDVYQEQTCITISGEIDIEILKKAFNYVIQNNEMLRTIYRWEKIDKPVQIVMKEYHIPFKIIDISQKDNIEKECIFKSILNEEKEYKINIGKESIKVTIVKFSNNLCKVIMKNHHILYDGWSNSIIIKDLIYAYNQFFQGLVPTKIKKTKYKEFLKWRLTQKREDTTEYWKQYLNCFVGYKKNTNNEHSNIFREMYHTIDYIDIKIIDEVKEYSKKNKVSIATILYSAWGYTRHIMENCNEIAFATTFSGRTNLIKDIDQIVGMFINTLPIRSKLKECETCREYILFFQECLRKHESYQYQSLVDIKSNVGIQYERELFNNLFIIENYPLIKVNQGDDKIKILDYQLAEESNFDLTVQIVTFDEYKINIVYDVNKISSSIIEIMMSCYKKTLINLIANGDMKLSDLQIINDKEEKEILQAIKENKILNLDYENNEETNATNVVITATFTAEPIGKYIEWWCNQFDEKVKVKFAPYNQVFQQLLDPNSLIANNFGVNVILLRFEDLIRHVKEDEDKIYILKKSCEDICNLITKEYNGVTLFGIFPVSTYLNLSRKIVDLIEELSANFVECIKKNKTMFVLDYNDLDKLYNIKQIFNEVTDREGHLPFEDEYYAAMGTMIARKICSIKKPNFKVIVLDCDNTLWGGVCGEDGGEHVNIKDEFEEFHKFLVQKHNEGILLALCSKNSEEDVWSVFEKREEMVLKKEHIVAYKINWRSKDDNIKELAQELNLGLESFIFIDDNPMEIARVMLNCPEVLSLQLPEEREFIPIFLQHVWAFDKERITHEDRNRTKMYKAEKKRKEIQNKQNSIDTFLKKLNLKVSMKLLEEEHIERVSQLTWRTNQFNLSTIRRSEEQIKELINNMEYKCWVIEVEDAFGEYGIVGVLITQKFDNKLFIESFLLSCRALGKGIEQSILLGIKKYCLKENIEIITIKYYPTQKNRPILDFINKDLWRKSKQTSEFTEYEMYCYEIPDTLEYIEFYFEQSFYKEVAICNKNCFDENYVNYKANIDATKKENIDFEINILNEDNLLHKSYFIPLKNNSGIKLINLPIYDDESKNIVSENIYEAPKNDLEGKLVKIWSEVLKINNIGINDSFFKLGGHSLKATILVGKIHKELGISIPLTKLFENYTIKKLAEHIKSLNSNEYKCILKAEKKDMYIVSSAQKRMYINNCIDRENKNYNIPIIFSILGEFDVNRVKEILKIIINRHEALRTHFEVVDGEVIQIINDEVKGDLEYYEVCEKELMDEIDKFVRPFNLSKAPLMRIAVMKINKLKHIFCFDIHHIISDGLSMRIILDEFMSLYNKRQLPEIKFQYKDYSEWERKYQETPVHLKEQEYWINKLKDEDLNSVGDKLIDYPRLEKQDFKGKINQVIVSEELTRKLKQIAVETRTTLNSVLLTVYNILIWKYTKQSKIIIGSPVSGRVHSDLENVVGMFVNMITFKNNVIGNYSFRAFLEEVKEDSLNSLENQAYPFDELVRKLGIKPSLIRNSIFDIVFAFQNIDSIDLKFDNLEVEIINYEESSMQFDLFLNACEKKNKIILNFEYLTSLFMDETIKRMSERYICILEKVVENLDIVIKDITFPKEVKQVNMMVNAKEIDEEFIF